MKTWIVIDADWIDNTLYTKTGAIKECKNLEKTNYCSHLIGYAKIGKIKKVKK